MNYLRLLVWAKGAAKRHQTYLLRELPWCLLAGYLIYRCFAAAIYLP